MSYYLFDPYHYFPKCYPYLNTNWQPYHSNRISQLGREIEEKSAISRLITSQSISRENQACQISLRKCRYKMEGINHNEEMTDIMAWVEGSRKVKEDSLRKISRVSNRFSLHSKQLQPLN